MNKDEICRAGNVLVQCRTYVRNVMDAQCVRVWDLIDLMMTWLQA